MSAQGAFRERLLSSWVEMRENFGRTALQALGVILGVAAVLGGFSISDSMRKQSEKVYARIGGFDKLRVNPEPIVSDGAPSALQMANLGLRAEDGHDGEGLGRKSLDGVSIQKSVQLRVRSSWADRERTVTGVGGDYFATEGYEVARGRLFSAQDLKRAAPVVVLGSEAAQVFFPSGDPVGQVVRVGDVPVTVVGVLREKVFRFRKGQHNVFRWRNRIVALPETLVARRMQGDAYDRVDRLTFRIRNLDIMAKFSKDLSALLLANHRQQEDFRLDDVAARIRREQKQGDIYDMVFLLSGILSLVGGGIVCVNIQMASLKERVREVGVKMAIGASGREIFKEFMTEALLVTGFGGLGGALVGVAFSAMITGSLGIPLFMEAKSFVWAFLLAAIFGFLFALYPAFKAARQSPMEALRYE